MLLVDLLIWILVCYGITNIVTGSSIMEPIRKYSWKINTKLGQLLECPMCFGFWAGILVSLAWVSPTGFIGPEWYNYILDGFIASGACWLLHTYEESTL